MSYFTFLMKKVYRKKRNIIPFVLLSIFIIIIYVGNQKSAFNDIKNPQYSGQSELKGVKKDLKMFQDELKHKNQSSEEYRQLTKNLSLAKEREKYLQNRLDAVHKKDWQDYYKNDADLTALMLQVVKADQADYEENTTKILQLNKEYAKYMADNHLHYDSRFSPSQGFSYMVQVADDFMPFLLVILMVFLLSTMYSSSYIDNMDIHFLIPSHYMKKQATKFMAGTLIGFLIIVFFSLLSIGCGWFGNSLGNFHTPVLTYTTQGATTFIPLINVVPQFLLLSMLSICFIANCISLVAALTKKNITCLILTLAILSGGMLITTYVVPLFPFMQFNPMTYLQTFKVVSGELLSITGNPNINFPNGVIVLILYNIVVYILYVCVYKQRMKRGVI